MLRVVLPVAVSASSAQVSPVAAGRKGRGAVTAAEVPAVSPEVASVATAASRQL